MGRSRARGRLPADCAPTTAIWGRSITSRPTLLKTSCSLLMTGIKFSMASHPLLSCQLLTCEAPGARSGTLQPPGGWAAQGGGQVSAKLEPPLASWDPCQAPPAAAAS